MNARHLICNMAPDGLGHAAGLRVGDTLVSVDGVEVSHEEALFRMLRAVPHGQTVTFVVRRRSDEHAVPASNAV